METYTFTRKGYEALISLIKKTEAILKKTIELKAEAGSGQDAWHDEQFKTGIADEMMWSQRLGELEDMCRRAQVIDPVEQNKYVALGVGVILERADGSISKYIVDGFMVDALDYCLSIQSPLGRAISGAKKGDNVFFKVGERDIKVKIKEIVAPSLADEVIIGSKQKGH